MVENTWPRVTSCTLTKSAESTSSLSKNDDTEPPVVTTAPQYLQQDTLVRIIVVVHLEADLSEKFKLNFGYILTGAPDPDNKDDILNRASYQKLIDTFRNEDFFDG